MTTLPAPPDGSFASDNSAGVSPEVIDALIAANRGPALAYGEDHWTATAITQIRELFDAPVEVLLCWGGTGANVVGLATMLEPWQSVICADIAHIVVDECGAPARFTGSTITPVAHVDGKLRTEAVEPFFDWLGSEHHPQPGVISISQVTEMGTVYSVDEIGTLADHAHRRGLLVHVDGARFANALAATNSSPVEMIRDSGVDVMTFGLTKNGAMYGDAVVYLKPELAKRAKFVRKQAGQLPSKSRFVAAQISALLTDDLWLRNASHANAMSGLLAEQVSLIPGVVVPRLPDANSVFAQLPAHQIVPLQDWSFFWEWDLSQSLVRWMTSFTTTAEDIRRFTAGVQAVLSR